MTTYRYLIADNASSTLAAGISPNSNALQVVSGGGALFPNPGPVEAFICTLIKNGSPGIREVIRVATRVGDAFSSITRNLDGKGALSWNAGDSIELRPTAELFQNFPQSLDVQAQGTNYALDVGSANAYRVNLNPALNGHVIGMPIRFIAQNSCTGDSTFNDGVGAAPIRVWTRAFGHSALYPNEITAGKLYTVFWDGTVFQLDVLRMYFDLMTDSILNSQVPLSAVLQWEASLAIAFSQLTGQIQSGQLSSNLALPGSPTTTTQAVGDNSTKIATTSFVNAFVQRGTVHVGDVNSPVGGSVTFPHSFTTPAVVNVSLIDANNHGASAVAAVDGIPTASGFSWAAREIASAVEDAYIHWTAVAS